ncbi:hypothetical protein Bca4012_010158 [Brassica carinata]
MELGGGSSNKRWGQGKASQGNVLCYCGIPAKICQAQTDKNPGRRFYGCENCKSDLIDAKSAIREKDKTIAELMKTIDELIRSNLVKEEEAEEDITINSLKL